MSLVLGFTWLHIVGLRSFRMRLSPLLISLCLLVLIALLQTLPLPEVLYESLAPTAKLERLAVSRAAEFLAIEPSSPELLEASRRTGAGHSCISISPIQSRASLVGLVSAIIMLLCCSYLFRDRTGKILLLVSLSLISTAVATLGVLQNISWSQWTLLGESVSRGFSTFVSRSSAPQYLSIGIGCTIAFAMSWLARKRNKSRHSQRYHATNWATRIRHSVEDVFREIDAVVILVAVAMVLQVAGVVGAASRGGFVALIFALSITVLLTLSRTRRFQVSGIAGAVVLAVLVLTFASSLELDEEISTRLEVERLDSTLRWEFWKLALSQSQFWWTGCGMGTFHFGIMQANQQLPVWIYHAESVFVEIFSEFGFAGFFIAMAGLGWFFWQLFKRRDSKSSMMWPAVLYSTCAIALQSLVDFSLIIPAIFISLAAIVGAYHHELQPDRRRREDLRSSRSSLKSKSLATAIFMGLAIVLWQGARPLSGFAQAERIESQDWSSRIESAFAAHLLPESPDLNHPEVTLQLAKRVVKTTEEYLQDLTQWPEEISSRDRAEFSRMEFASSLLRSPEQDRWAGLVRQWAADERLAKAIQAASIGFASCTQDCLYDWRGHWGQFQTRVGSDAMTHALNCARLQLLTKSMPQMQQAAGTCELLAGNPTIGIHFWKTSLAIHPEQTFRVSALVGTVLDDAALESILPETQIPRAVLCRTLMQRTETRESGQQLLEKVQVDAAIAEAESEFEWNVVAWLAQQTGETNGYIEALRKLAIFRPMDKSVRIKLAETLESVGAIEEAIQQVEQANRRSLLSPAEELLLERLREKHRLIR